ncbi:MAG: hypothetical protein JST89_04055 [Cyanobacteria bacterium SZAS-4]|nr:hypothetical protein [Cyanobacteria bacterium SZAS-4]
MARISLHAQTADAAHVSDFTKNESDSSHVSSERQSGTLDLIRQSTSARAADSKVLASAGIIGDLQLTSVGDQMLLGSSKEDQKLIDDYNALSKKTGAPELTTAEKFALHTLPSDQKEMYRLQIESLTKLANKEINPAQYMAESLRNAAKLAEKNEGSWWNPFGSSKEQLFVDYVGLAFCDKSLGLGKDIVRAGAGSPFDLAGAALERTYAKLVTNEAAKGFNTNITDTNDPDNTVTHHYREFLMVGYNSGRTIGNWAATEIDKPDINPGDVRNGYFGTMIGSALWNGKITPSEAAEMTIWAYTAHGGKQPPWGDRNVTGSKLTTDDYFLNPWLKAYRSRDTN